MMIAATQDDRSSCSVGDRSISIREIGCSSKPEFLWKSLPLWVGGWVGEPDQIGCSTCTSRPKWLFVQKSFLGARSKTKVKRIRKDFSRIGHIYVFTNLFPFQAHFHDDNSNFSKKCCHLTFDQEHLFDKIQYMQEIRSSDLIYLPCMHNRPPT